jgi:hypothetical protein
MSLCRNASMAVAKVILLKPSAALAWRMRMDVWMDIQAFGHGVVQPRNGFLSISVDSDG